MALLTVEKNVGHESNGKKTQTKVKQKHDETKKKTDRNKEKEPEKRIPREGKEKKR